MADRTLAEVGEVGLVDRILEVLGGGESAANDAVRVGPGDDAAVLRCDGDVVVTTDAQHERVHFERAWIAPRDLGARAIAVNASDLGAMGARPRGFVVALALPPSIELEWVVRLAEGLRDGARALGGEVVGGDVAAVAAEDNALAINVTAVGFRGTNVDAGRHRARPGQRIFLTGWPGRAAAGRELLRTRAERAGGGPRERDAVGFDGAAARCVAAFRRPAPPVALGVAAAEQGLVAAMMDVSDGVGIDLRRLCRASGVGARLDAERLLDDETLGTVAREHDLDHQALVIGGGEDYELLCTVEADNVAGFRALAAGHGVRLQAIGAVVDAVEGLTLRSGDRDEPLPAVGWDHFTCR